VIAFGVGGRRAGAAAAAGQDADDAHSFVERGRVAQLEGLGGAHDVAVVGGEGLLQQRALGGGDLLVEGALGVPEERGGRGGGGVRAGGGGERGAARGGGASAAATSAAPISGASLRMRMRSTAFSSSRTFPGQS
jgi:hypothetical protein